MSKKKKSRFQKYLDRQGLNDSTDISQGDFQETGMSDEVRLSYTNRFYRQYVEDLKEIGSVAGMRIFSGISEYGNCIITEKGGFFCESRGLAGGPITYLRASEDLLTEDGAYTRYYYTMQRAVNSSESNHHILDKKHLLSRITSFRMSSHITDELKSFGLTMNDTAKYPIWFDGYNRFFFLYLSPLGYPVSKISWRFDGDLYKEDCWGVPIMMDCPDADRIYFVENPMQLVTMSELVSDPVYVRPRTSTNHRIDDLIKGKQILCMKAKDPRNADPASLELIELGTDSVEELLYTYDQDMPKKGWKKGNYFWDFLTNFACKSENEANASINFYLKEKGIQL